MTKTPDTTPQPNYPDQIIGDKTMSAAQPSRECLQQSAEAQAWLAHLPSSDTQNVYDSRDDAGYIDDLTNNDDAVVTPLYAALQAAPPAPAGVAVPGECEAFEAWIEKRGVWPRLTFEEVFFAGYRAAIAAAPAQAVPSGMWTIWEALPGYLIDHCEGDIISEEGLQRALEAMLKNPQYSMPPAAAAQAPKATGTAHLPYFSYDEDAGVQFWATQERAIKECQDAIDAYREDVEDGWPDDVESVRWGVVLGRAVKTDERPDHSCDYALTPYAAPAQEHATQLAGQGQTYSIDADPEGIRARVADAITGALAFGAQGGNTPPPEHWLTPFWMAARFEAAQINTLREWMNAQPAAAAPVQAQEDARDGLVEHVISAARNAVDASFEVMDDFAIEGHLVAALSLALDELDAARAAQGGAA